ncbi:hypothetical protein J2X31_002170 [Flavobacterium arsenatis]|uniref:Uncharacterized protein n=1 Tax=Flavobacterium arsenatis TaxID=1484332 RepID=A0ABU1TQ90_9FLAO|nr:hypothetical protein [Flavobacterium arsenatis]MDR6968155.1 hypothetical protein [Flavobacterium arsenatis]
MKIKQKITIDFLEFFKTGKFDYIKLGQTKEWILNNFPNPDDFFADDWVKQKGYDIWTYGNIEFHFQQEKLFLIFSDHFNNAKLSGGKHIKINPWILKDTSKLTLQFVLAELNNQNIDFKKKTDNLGILLRLQSGIELTFENWEDIDGCNPNDFRLTSFSLIEENPNRWK